MLMDHTGLLPSGVGFLHEHLVEIACFAAIVSEEKENALKYRGSSVGTAGLSISIRGCSKRMGDQSGDGIL